jgi:LysM repeat protein
VIVPSSTPRPFTPLPPAPIIGTHTVLGGETIFCLGRTYGVLPAAIAQNNGLQVPFTVFPGQVLRIPQVQWQTISAGPVCAPQFTSPYPGLPVPTATSAATATPSGPPLVITEVRVNCISNCGTSEGEYVLRVEASASGGIAPYTFSPALPYDVSVQHCSNGSGNVTVTSADGQFATLPWFFDDVNC